MDYRKTVKDIIIATDLTAIQIADMIGASNQELHSARYSTGHLNPRQLEELEKLHADALLAIDDRASVEDTTRRIQIKHGVALKDISFALGYTSKTVRHEYGPQHLEKLLELEDAHVWRQVKHPGTPPEQPKMPRAYASRLEVMIEAAEQLLEIQARLEALGITQDDLLAWYATHKKITG